LQAGPTNEDEVQIEPKKSVRITYLAIWIDELILNFEGSWVVHVLLKSFK